MMFYILCFAKVKYSFTSLLCSQTFSRKFVSKSSGKSIPESSLLTWVVSVCLLGLSVKMLCSLQNIHLLIQLLICVYCSCKYVTWLVNMFTSSSLLTWVMSMFMCLRNLLKCCIIYIIFVTYSNCTCLFYLSACYE